MTFNDNQKQAIIEYGEAKYAQGCKDGFISGILSGSLLTMIVFLTATIIKERH